MTHRKTPSPGRLRWALALGLLTLVLRPQAPLAWESATTHAGLLERSALASVIHSRIERDIGISGGLFARLVIPPADAPATIELLGKFNPTHGYVPDSRGRQMAIGWLAAGAALADSPARYAANHFLDPTGLKGLDDHTLDQFSERSKHRLGASRADEKLIRSGAPAHEWASSADNPLGVTGFYDQYRKAVTAKTPGERERHLAGALLAAGAVVHVLQDMASPSHVRIDLAAHVDSLSGSAVDVGSRLERIAALAYGRLGIPATTNIVRKDRLTSFFVDSDGTGLAQIVATRFFSRYTLPVPDRLPVGARVSTIANTVRKALARDDVTLEPAGSGFRVLDSRGTCLALFEVEGRDIRFFTNDRCVLSQLEELLPLAVGYGTGALDFLFRGNLVVKTSGKGLSVTSPGGIGDGELLLLWDDAKGVRSQFHKASVRGALPKGLPAAPSGAGRVVAVYVGTDARGEAVVATGSIVPGS